MTPQDWKVEIESFQPDMLMVESAWRGKDDLWENKVVHLSYELKELIKYCKLNSIPTIFWNKEDPYHFNDFIETAKLFDFVFTTDINCIPEYKTILKHVNVFILPFACQPRIHNPIEKYERKNAFVFAGAYYNRFPRRNALFSMMVNVLASEGEVDIYDRNYGNEKTVFKYPEEYQHFIRGGLAYDQIDKAYKGYKYAINLNSMTESLTMFSRRVFELMASNTIVLSNYTVGTQTLLGDLIVSTDSTEELKEKVQLMNQEPLYEKKIRLAALRKVMSEHTAQVRLNEIAEKVFSDSDKVSLPHVTCISYAKEQGQIQQIRKAFFRQSYPNKSMLIVCEDKIFSDSDEVENIIYIERVNHQKVADYLINTDYIAGLSMNDYYGKNYLTDLILATRYTNAKIIAKGGCYTYDKKKGLALESNTSLYTTATFTLARLSIFKKSILAHRLITDFAKNIDTEHYTHESIFLIDEFNYCKNGLINRLDDKEKIQVDDLFELDTGISIDDRWINKQLKIIIHRNQIEKKSDQLLTQLKSILNELGRIQFARQPIKKIKRYKKLISIFKKIKSY